MRESEPVIDQAEINAQALPIGSILAAGDAVAIKRYSRLDQEDYWMPAEGWPLPLSNRQMQHRIQQDSSYRILRIGSGE
jgi:hypothetical protein